jgi:glutamate synthase (NADPH/NADH) small chain
MGNLRGFLEIKRQDSKYRPLGERVKDYAEVMLTPKVRHSQEQASRCLDCGTPFCHWSCPIGNFIPEYHDLVFKQHWQKAYELFSATNNFPEITGRLCPALCEFSCVLGINDEPVTIRENELAIMEEAFNKGWVRPHLPSRRSGRKVAIVGSGPAGLAAAAQLNQAGHRIVVFEAGDKIGGLLRYGIPDFKLPKEIIERRLEIFKKEGIEFRTGINIGRDYSVKKLSKEFDAVCLAGGSRQPRDLNIEGRQLEGIYFALDYLIQANRIAQGEEIPRDKLIDTRGKRVVIIGGGDTGADCLGVAHRQGASSAVQIELLPQPPVCRPEHQPWPCYPMILKTSSSHEEGGERLWSVFTKEFIGKQGRLKSLSCVKVEFKNDNQGCPAMKEIKGSEFEIETDVAILALGFLGPQKEGLLQELGLELDSRGNVKTDASYMTSCKGMFAAGDMRRGQSLVVWAISEGRRVAHEVDKYLMGKTNLPLI